MSQMTHRERVLAALNLEQPDKVPFIESKIDQGMQEKIMGTKDFTPPELAKKLNMDGFSFNGLLPPVFANIKNIDGREHIMDGLITSPDKLELMDFPDPDDDALYEPAIDFIEKYKGDYAVFAIIRLGIAPTLWSMGIDNFSFAIYDNPGFVKQVIRNYASWTAKIVEKINEIGFDFIWAADDIAFRSNTMFSPAVFKEFFVPEIKKVTDNIKIPWVYHSDGNVLPVLDILLEEFKPNGINPIDPAAMDLAYMKKTYGNKVCLIGNIDLNYTLTRGKPHEVRKEVQEKIKIAAPGGGYIISSANSLTDYCKVENVFEMAKAIQEYGRYPIDASGME